MARRKILPPQKPPKQPKRGRQAGNGADDHQQRLRESRERIDGALSNAGIPPEQKTEFRRAILTVLQRLTPTALQRVHRAVKEYRFYPTFTAMTEAIKKKYPKIASKIKPGNVAKGFMDRDGTMHLNGGGILFKRPAKLVEFYAHEVAHAIDRPTYEISGSEEWESAWAQEIRDMHFLSDEAKMSPEEGFSEFGAMVLGSGIAVADAKQVMPGCVRVWQEHGLL